MYNANKGYVGWSMSERAASAYDSGEMPKSKWTKTAMLAAIETFCADNALKLDPSINGMKKDEMFSRFFRISSWHHASRYFNETDFYEMNEDAVRESFAPMTDEEAEEAEAVKRAEIERRAAESREMKAREEAEIAAREEFRNAHGFDSNTVSAYMLAHPELCEVRTSKKSGKAVIDARDASGKILVTCPELDASRQRVPGFDATKRG